jgi:cytochrome c oxidase subunit 2
LIAGAALVVVAVLLILVGGGSGSDALKVDVFAHQYSWRFGYPDDGNGISKELHVPLGHEVEFEMHSQDVPHGFWVPEWAIKEDIESGKATFATATPDKAGTFQVVCSELCGIEHFNMTAKIVVESPEEYDKWVAGLKRKVPDRLTELMRLDSELEAIREDHEGS